VAKKEKKPTDPTVKGDKATEKAKSKPTSK
jgi:hypothetical protein